MRGWKQARNKTVNRERERPTGLSLSLAGQMAKAGLCTLCEKRIPAEPKTPPSKFDVCHKIGGAFVLMSDEAIGAPA